MFTWTVNYDENRYADGIALRRTYVEEEELDENHLEVEAFLKSKKCTVFEMMIGVAKRIEFAKYDHTIQKDRTNLWFMMMLENLGLDKFPDSKSKYDNLNPVDELKVDKIIETMVDRTYDYDGNGSLFPLNKAPTDWRKTEIWYQMQGYLTEEREDNDDNGRTIIKHLPVRNGRTIPSSRRKETVRIRRGSIAARGRTHK